MLSIDKPVYRLGETVHIKATVTNLTPRDMSFDFRVSMVKVENSTMAVWMNPKSDFAMILGPPPWEEIYLLSGETKSLILGTADWNMKGLYTITTKANNIVSLRVYEGTLVPAGEYTVIWPLHIHYREFDERLDETISFTITK